MDMGSCEDATKTGGYLMFCKGCQRLNTKVAGLLGGHEQVVVVLME